MLQGVRRSKAGARSQKSEAADVHISQKVRSLRLPENVRLPS